MAASKLLLFSIFLALVFARIRADASGEEAEEFEVVRSEASDSSSSLKIELEQLRAKIAGLESLVDERTQELKSKDDIIAQKERVIRENSNSLDSLQTEIASLQKKRTIDAQEQVGKAHARAGELENQVDELKKELEMQNQEKVALQARLTEAEDNMRGLNLKLQNLQTINDEQKIIIRKTERALQIAEEEMMKAKFEATSKTRDLMEVHGAWLPPWLAVHFFHCQSFMVTEWNEHGKPVMDKAIQKAMETKAQAEKWAEPHMETFKTKLIPAIKEQWLVIVTKVEPHVQSMSAKTIWLYETSKNAITPHVIKAQQIADPYFQEAKKVSKPYIDQIATVTRPHLGKVRVALRPYAKKAVHAYGKFLKSATMYHNQVQDSVQEKLKKHELTRTLATKELVWFVASALLALPIIILCRICSAIFCKKTRKPTRNANTHHMRRKTKRGHPDRENAAR
ncbi:uncharacterized protein LOC131151835 isoform X2 [Malania oleifera]|uniref:uncharacterized protein LOC131151835 isoform X2 n=1 Tax=Malania oleifera TaxID=397392 RepID=UPI0025AEA953|nr:uncharacterized protein LOC131151835 isoform X2 [Malania oleifera]XP_057959254.1 uncharacterized protein LOC131151835 isoform X2 [Malania oleifera]